MQVLSNSLIQGLTGLPFERVICSKINELTHSKPIATNLEMKRLEVKNYVMVFVLAIFACYSAWKYSQQAITRGDGPLELTGEQFIVLAIYFLGIVLVVPFRRVCDQFSHLVEHLNHRKHDDSHHIRR